MLPGCASKLEKARSARKTEDFERAEELYRKVIGRSNSDSPIASRELGEMKVEVGRKLLKEDAAKSEVLFREALTLDKDSEPAKDGLGRALAGQNREDEAIAVLSGESEFGACTLCRRYLGVVLLARGKRLEGEGKFAAARADFERTVELVPEIETAFAIARTHEAEGNDVAAAEAVEKALPLITEDDARAQERFQEIREAAVKRAIAAGDMETAERYLKMFPPGSGGEPWYDLQLLVAREQWRRGDVEPAISRLEPLLGEDHKELLPDSRRPPIEALLARMYQVRGAQRMREGDPAGADEWFSRAQQLATDDDGVKVLRALAIAGKGELDTALKVIAALPENATGRSEVEAILYSNRVHERVKAGDLAGAKDALTRAQASKYEQPEVHVAAAAVLAATPLPPLSRGDAKTLKKFGVVSFPDEPRKYGEALSELAWARTQAAAQGERYLYRAADFARRLKDTEDQIRRRYPYAVAFNEDSSTILALTAKSGTDVDITGPYGYEESVFIAPGKTVEVTLPQPGLVVFRIGRDKKALYSEPYTRVAIEF
ncbi:MAG: hypothetical protein R3A51_21105 [Nannocystaceae bacterium]|nr:hypothetical protein [Myxococcales bacterium]